jgi:hypothetical protein
MRVEITRTTPIYNNPATTGVFVQWKVEQPPANTAIVFAIERAGSPEGPFEAIASNINTFHYFDGGRHIPVPTDGTRENLNFLSLQRNIYYRITATAGTETVQSVEPVGDQLPRRQFLLRRKMHRDIRVGFKFSSVPLIVLKRRHWGLRCRECFDLLTKKVTKSRCETCYSTGFEGGFFDPVKIEGRLSVYAVQEQMTQQDIVENEQKQLTVLDYPLLEIEDVVAELRMNKRYVVKHVSRTELRTVPVHQRAVLSELSRDAIEYRLFINEAHIPVIY